MRAAYSTKTRDLQQQAQTAAAQAAAERERREAAECREKDAARDLEAERKRREAIEGDIERERRLRQDEAMQAETTLATERKKIDELQRQEIEERDRRARRRRVTLGVALTAFGSAVGVIAYLTRVSSSLGVAAFAVAGTGLLLLGIRLTLGSKWGGEVVTWLFGLIGVIGTALGVIALVASQGG